MSFIASVSKKTVVLALLAAAAILSVAGHWIAGDLRSLTQTVMLPLSQPGTSLALTIRERSGDIGPLCWRLQRERDEARVTAETFRYALQAERARFQERMRKDQEEKDIRYSLLNGFPCDLVAARVVAEQSLPYGDARVVRTSVAKPGQYVTTIDLLTDRAKSLPEQDLLAIETLDSKALVGRVVSSRMAAAQVQLVTDKDFQIGAMIWYDLSKPRDIDTGHRSEPLTAKNGKAIPTTIRGDGRGGMIATCCPATGSARTD
jgi:hypothetical protein